MNLGWILYLFLLVILYMFWREVRGEFFSRLLRRSALEHQQVHKILKEHPSGGTWDEFKRWKQEASS